MVTRTGTELGVFAQETGRGLLVSLKYLSVCSGIEAATVAWHHMGWQPVAFSDIEPFPSAVLAHHYPNVPNLGDMTKFEEWNLEPIDLLVGGTPCQSFSVAGLRKGLADPRGNLMLTYLAIAQRHRPQWLVWENVPGVLSSNGGRDFGTFLGALGQLGYGFAYRVLDAQWFGVAQRRRRVFVVGYLGDWRRAAQVLFERESVCRNPAPSREARQETAKRLTAGVGKRFNPEHETLPVAFDWQSGGDSRGLDPKDTAQLQRSQVPAVAQPVAISGDVAGTLDANYYKGCGSANYGEREVIAQPSAFPINTLTLGGRPDPVNDARMTLGVGADGDPQFTLQAAHSHAVATAMQVRRLTPVECERLQGFPDNYTRIPWKLGYWAADKHSPEVLETIAKQCPDGPRYKALGNSMAVPVMRWIGERIANVEETTNAN
jgi:DNA (cytosine-5)-methyltransferase 1